MAYGRERLLAQMRSLLGDQVLGALLRGSTVALAMSAVGQGLSVILQVYFARYMGEIEYGVYSYVIAWLSVGLIAGKLGFDTALVRYVAGYASRDRTGLAVAVWNLARRRSLAASVIAAPVLGLAAWFSAEYDSPSLLPALLIFAILLPVAAVGELAAAALRGLKRIGSAMCADAVIRPVAAAAIFGLLVQTVAPTAVSAMSAYAGGIAIGATMTLLLLRGAFRGVQPVQSRGQLTRIWVSSAATLMLANGFLVLLYTVDVILLGALESTTAAGLYSVASKLAILVLFVMNAAQAIGGPLLAEAYAARRTSELRRVIRVLNALTALSAIPAAAILAFGAEWFLGIFGEGFAPAASALRLLALMQVLNVLTGPVGILLSMTGRQRILAALLAAGFAMHFVLCLILIPRYGLIGAAWSALAAHAAWNLAGAVIVWQVAAVDCSVLDWLRRFDGTPADSGSR